MDEELKREIILEHYQNPKNKETITNNHYIKMNSNNESCIDNINLYVLIEEDRIKDIKFDGEACAISTSSTSIMTVNLIGKTIEEANKYIKNFEAMVNEQDYDEEILKEGNAYNTIYKQNNRKHCALLPYIGIKKILNKKDKDNL